MLSTAVTLPPESLRTSLAHRASACAVSAGGQQAKKSLTPSLGSGEEHHRLGSDAFHPADESEMLGGRRLDVHRRGRNAEVGGDVLHHARLVGRDARRLG